MDGVDVTSFCGDAKYFGVPISVLKAVAVVVVEHWAKSKFGF